MYRDQSSTKERPPERRIHDERRQPPKVALRDKPSDASDDERPPEQTQPTGPLARIEAMSAEECMRAYRAGRLTRAERTAWAAAYPDEAPIVNDELEWIALSAE
jgi:hypothetical protein